MKKPSQLTDESNEPGEISLQGLNSSFSMDVENPKQPGSPQSGEIGEMSRSQTFQMQALVHEEFSLIETAPVPFTQEGIAMELQINQEPDQSQANQPSQDPTNDQTEKSSIINQEQQVSSMIRVQNELITNAFEQEQAPLQENTQMGQQLSLLVDQQEVPITSEEQGTNDQPEHANLLLEEQSAITRPKEQPLKLLPQPFPMNNYPKEQPQEDKYPLLSYQAHSQKPAKQYDDFQKQSLLSSFHLVREPKLEPSQLLSKYNQADHQMSQLIQPCVQLTEQKQLGPNIHQQQIQDNPQLTQGNPQVECKQGEQKQIIEILEDMEHDEETPVFGVPNNVTEILVEETQNLSIEEQKVNQVQGDLTGAAVVMQVPVPIDLEEPSQVRVDQSISPNSQPSIPTSQQLVQQPTLPPVQPTTIPQTNLNPHPSPHLQTTQIIIQSQQQQQIIVPQKVPQQQQPTLNQTIKLNAQNIRNLLLQTQSDWTDIIRNASEAEILQFYQELTNKIEIQCGEQGEMHEQQQQKEQIVVEQSFASTDQKQLIQTQQQPQHIQLQPQTTTAIISIPQQQPAVSAPLIQYLPQNQAQLATHPTTSPNEFQQFQLITAALYQTSPQLKQQIMKLSNQQLRALYRETMQENRKKEQTRSKNKKKKNAQQAVIDLEDQSEGAGIEKSGDSERQLIVTGQVSSQPQQQQPQKSTFSYLSQYQKRKSQSKKSPHTVPTPTSLYINKTLLYSLIKSHDYQNKLKSLLQPKQSIKYQQKTQKQIVLLYLNHLKKNNIAKGPFQSTSMRQKELTVLCKKKEDVKGQNFRKMAKEGLCLGIKTNLSEEKKQRILELRQQRIQGITQLPPTTTSDNAHTIPPITTLPSTIPTLPITISTTHPASLFPQLTAKTTTPRRRYCLIVQQELSPREQQQIALQYNKKRVKKSSNPEEQRELLGMLRRMIELEE